VSRFRRCALLRVPIDAELPEAFWVALLERLAGNAGGHGDAGADVAAEA
jgi:hypothetical protein